MDAKQQKLIGELYLEMYDRLMSYARSALGETLGEEAVQDTFRIACQKSEELYESLNPRGWLVKTLRNTVQNTKRSRASSRQLLSRYLASQGSIAFSEDKVSLEVLYADVADTEEFRLIKEMAVDGRSHLEMAAARGITVDACKKRVQRAKAALQKKI